MPLDRLPARRSAWDDGRQAAAKAQQRVEKAHAKAVRKRAKRVARAREALPSQLVVAVGAGVVAFGFEVLDLLAYPAAAVAAVGALRSVRTLRRPAPPPPRPVPAVPPPPDRRSAAAPAVRRLDAVRAELRRLLPLVAPAGRGVAEEAWLAAAEADGALRWQAARLSAVEPHLGADPVLLRALGDGVARQERLVQAVADLVAASADPLSGTRLQDATDAVHGLAQGLREVR